MAIFLIAWTAALALVAALGIRTFIAQPSRESARVAAGLTVLAAAIAAGSWLWYGV